MKKSAILIPLLLTLGAFAQQDRTWLLDQSTLTYHVSHPLHETEGTSHAARGKGVCHGGQCDFLIAAEVKTFDSGDTNRDLHMLQTVRGAQFPVVSVRLRLPESQLASPTLDCDLEIQLAGATAHYSHVALQQTIAGNSHRITGVLPTTVSDFKIDPPSFFTVPIKNNMPVRIDLTWHSQ